MSSVEADRDSVTRCRCYQVLPLVNVFLAKLAALFVSTKHLSPNLTCGKEAGAYKSGVHYIATLNDKSTKHTEIQLQGVNVIKFYHYLAKLATLFVSTKHLSPNLTFGKEAGVYKTRVHNNATLNDKGKKHTEIVI